MGLLFDHALKSIGRLLSFLLYCGFPGHFNYIRYCKVRPVWVECELSNGTEVRHFCLHTFILVGSENIRMKACEIKGYHVLVQKNLLLIRSYK